MPIRRAVALGVDLPRFIAASIHVKFIDLTCEHAIFQ